MLRALRSERDWTVEHVAQLLDFSPSKVSRLETGHRGASSRDIRDLADLYEVDDEMRERMTSLAAEGKQRSWWQPLNLPYSTYIGLEAEARSISDYGIHVVPGLLQTADYARAVVRALLPDLAPEVVEQRVQGRIARQRILTADGAPRFDAVVDESVLHRVVGGAKVMRAQLARIAEVARLDNVSFKVVPYEAGLPPALSTKFIILRFGSAAIPDLVYLEHLTGDAYLDSPRDLKSYEAIFRALSQVAASSAQTQEILDRKIAYFTDRSR